MASLATELTAGKAELGSLLCVRVLAQTELWCSGWQQLAEALCDEFSSHRLRLLLRSGDSLQVVAGQQLLGNNASASLGPRSPLTLHCGWSLGSRDTECRVAMATVADAEISARLAIDCLCLLSPSDGVEEQLRQQLADYVRCLGDAVAAWRCAIDTNYFLIGRRLIRCLYPRTDNQAALKELRASWHKELGFGSEAPLFRPQLRIRFGQAPARQQQQQQLTAGSAGDEQRLLLTPHSLLPPQSEAWVTETVRGDYRYYHYTGRDQGWGCAYRSLQTLVSWLQLQGLADCQTPSHEDIQRALVELKDKPAKLIGSRQWLGAVEVSLALQHLAGVRCRLLHVSRGAELADNARLLLHHFATVGAPVMIGGGQYAHTLLGCSLNEATGDLRWLVLDPHYVGQDEAKAVLRDGWCGWKPASFFKQTVHYNLCLMEPDAGVWV